MSKKEWEVNEDLPNFFETIPVFAA